ncbi:hypothetical protein MUCCIDRAFT_163979 [Mucor lusitanicus CBS 277.49]|uniref:Uncharacterized protein n=1 Tax=Mucor lusitanicus CBS 277.49 TaxID=747725 RepID=A0A168K641_MUCCL|nr:hypothetical protein MUCCIDRAFT_163979 [Mucor lusitanicus CBS 277.49]
MSHSLIFNLREIVWGNYFEDYETDEIRQYNAVELPEMPADVIKYLSQLKGLTEEEIYNKLSTENFDIVSDEKWIQEAFSQAVRLMKCRVLPINKAKQIISCCTKHPRSGVAIRQKPGRKMEFFFTCKDYEVGCGEAGMDVIINGTTDCMDCGYKMPKVMRDIMLVKLVAHSPSLKRKLVLSAEYYIGEIIIGKGQPDEELIPNFLSIPSNPSNKSSSNKRQRSKE